MLLIYLLFLYNIFPNGSKLMDVMSPIIDLESLRAVFGRLAFILTI